MLSTELVKGGTVILGTHLVSNRAFCLSIPEVTSSNCEEVYEVLDKCVSYGVQPHDHNFELKSI